MRWLCFVLLVASCSRPPVSALPDAGPPPPELPRKYTPRWAFEPWISKDISDGPDTYAFVKGFKDRDIPVGAVVLDSPWETNYNTFTPNPKRYPDFAKMVADLHAQDVRTVLWVTQMVNETSFDVEVGGDSYDGPAANLKEGLARGYFVNGGAKYEWWKGIGCGVDFLNPAARDWWHAQQEQVLGAGIDGWKLDFGDSYVTTATVQTAQGEVAHQEYSEAYYRDTLAYGRSRRGKDFLTMVRPWDESYEFKGRFFARPEDAPVGWVGDNRRDDVGLADALDEMFRSAAAGYVVVGSDIGGYLDKDDHQLAGPSIPFQQEVFARWTAMAALTPFMQLHGKANITPWTVPQRPDETVALYRYWSKLHSQLVPFFFSLAQEQYAGRGQLLRPVGEPSKWPGDYRFQLGESFLVAPYLDATRVRDVELPSDARWYDWWTPDGEPLLGGQILRSDALPDRLKSPLFVREGAIVPLDVKDATTALGTTGSAGAITLLAWPAASESRFTIHEEDGSRTEVTCVAQGGGAKLTMSRALRPVLARLRLPGAAGAAKSGTQELARQSSRAALDSVEAGFFEEPAARSVWVKVPASAAAFELTVSAP